MGSEEELYPHKTFYLLPDFTGSPFLAFLSQGSVLLGKDQMLPVCTCFTEVFPFVWRILFEARNENSFDCCLLDYFEAVGLGEDVRSLIRGPISLSGELQEMGICCKSSCGSEHGGN